MLDMGSVNVDNVHVVHIIILRLATYMFKNVLIEIYELLKK